MKKSFVLLIILIIIAACKNSNQKEDTNFQVDKITEKEALNLLHTWTNAYLTGNATRLNEILDDSWLYAGSTDGKTTDKNSTIAEFSNADYSFSDITYQDLKVQLYDDIAILRGSENMLIVGGNGKDTTKLRLRFTDVYQKKNGEIRAIATHSSPIDD